MPLIKLPYEYYIKLRDSLDPATFDNEIWTDVKGAENYYQVSSLGRFKAKCDIIYTARSRFGKIGDIKHRKGDIIKQSTVGEYIVVTLYIPYVSSTENTFSNQYAHIIIYDSFHTSSSDKVKDHIDGIKHNNQLVNLQELTPMENSQKSYDNDESNRWSNRKSGVIRSDGKVYNSIKAAALDGNGSDAAIISAIRTGGTCARYTWKYADTVKQNKIDAEKPIKRAVSHGKRTNLSYVAKCTETGKIQTVAQHARDFNCVSDTIYHAIDYCNGYSKYLNAHFILV